LGRVPPDSCGLGRRLQHFSDALREQGGQVRGFPPQRQLLSRHGCPHPTLAPGSRSRRPRRAVRAGRGASAKNVGGGLVAPRAFTSGPPGRSALHVGESGLHDTTNGRRVRSNSLGELAAAQRGATDGAASDFRWPPLAMCSQIGEEPIRVVSPCSQIIECSPLPSATRFRCQDPASSIASRHPQYALTAAWRPHPTKVHELATARQLATSSLPHSPGFAWRNSGAC
jgi:hypothetical protein